MSDLVAFLAARLDEDEAAAKAWLPFGNPDTAQREHIARHDPARVLHEVAAAREDLAELAEFEAETDPEDDAFHKGELLAFRRVIKRRAAVYSDHPDYDEAWKVEA